MSEQIEDQYSAGLAQDPMRRLDCPERVNRMVKGLTKNNQIDAGWINWWTLNVA
jgi:hypothetical protein